VSALTLRLPALPPSSRVWLGLSGGLDSSVLLHLLAHQPALAARLHVIHVHHGLSPNADAWAEHCRQQAEQFQLPFTLEKVQVDRDVSSLELAARNARFQAFSQHLHEDDVLVTAHHLNDQAETFLLRLMRGSGLDGLTAMKEWSRFQHFHVWRPLLNHAREELEQYAAGHRLRWIEDESNRNLQFDRNFMRRQLLPLLQQRWPQATRLIARAASNLQDSQQVLEQCLDQDLKQLDQGGRLYWPGLQTLSAARINAILRSWLQRHGVQALSAAQLAAMVEMMLSTKQDATPVFEWEQRSIRRYRDYLYVVNEPDAEMAENCLNRAPLAFTEALPWGRLQAQLVTVGARLNAALIKPEQLTVRFRAGATRIRLAQHAHSSDLKKLLQAAGCPPWLRPYLPLLYYGDQLVCIPEIGVAEGWQASADAPGWAIQWDQFLRAEK